MKISFDIGGVLSKYPEKFRKLIDILLKSEDVEVYVITDMHIHEQSVKFVHGNGFNVADDHILNADFAKYGEQCKEKVIEEYGIDMHFDDFPGYCANNKCINLFVWPNPELPYYSDTFITDGSEGSFGRRIKNG